MTSSDIAIKQIQTIIRKQKCSHLVISHKDTSHRWILGSVVSDSLLFIPASGKATMIVSPLSQYVNTKISVLFPKTYALQSEAIAKLVRKSKRIAVSGSTCSLRLQTILGLKKTFVDVEKQLLELRATKTPNEISNLEKANALTVKCFDELLTQWHKFSHENDATNFIKLFALTHNIGLAFDPIVASGPNASVAHHSHPTKLNRGFCVLDFGFTVNGYHADMTRTIYIGKPSTREILRYNQLLEIQEAAVSLVKPGVKCSDLHNYVLKMLGADAKLFIHSLGHGVGLDIHELPNVSAKSESVLNAGMAITIEPGIYSTKLGFGLRIEDSVLVVKGGHINMTKKASKSLIVLN